MQCDGCGKIGQNLWKFIITAFNAHDMRTENPYSTPVADPTLAVDPSAYAGTQLATLSQRFTGAFVDGLISIVAVAPVMVVLFMMGAMNQRGGMGPVASIAAGLIVFVLCMAIQYVPLKQSGQTWGKKVAKTRIVTMDGAQPSIGDLIGKRYAFFQLIGIIPVVGTIASLVNILMIFKKDRRCLHDMIAGTQVIQVQQP